MDHARRPAARWQAWTGARVPRYALVPIGAADAAESLGGRVSEKVMRRQTGPVLAILVAGAAAAAGAAADVKVTVERNATGGATEAFRFRTVPTPNTRAVARASISVVDGTMDENCGRDAAHLGKRRLPEGPDDPAGNFFFAGGTDGGRLRVDLGGPVVVREVNTYSWHPGSRGPQVYTLYAADGSAKGFEPAPRKGTDPTACGWTRVASVDTRGSGGGRPGGQYGVSIADPAGALGTFRYLLLDVSQTEHADGFGNTFYSKVDVIADQTAATTRP